MNRRQTLGGLSPSQLNSRQSLGPSRIGKDGKAAKKTDALWSGRQSLAGGRLPSQAVAPAAVPSKPAPAAAAGAQRRSSTAYSKPAGVKTDPRPVSDKAYQGNCIRLLIQYLSTHGYDHPISPKLLTNPMSKDFTHIAQFLFRQIDPNIKTFGKIEDDVPVIFKRLKYPFQISKSALFAVGSPHTWPGLLAALVWVVELLSYEEKAEEARINMFDDKQRAESDFFEYVAKSYKYFLAGDDYQAQGVDDEKALEFEEQAEAVRIKSEQLRAANDQLQAQIDQIRNEPSPLLAARAKKEEHISDREKFHKLIENLQNHKQTLLRKTQERQADLKSKQDQLLAASQENEEMKEKIAAQTVNRDDVIRMNNERTKQAEILQSVAASREALERRVSEQEVQVEHRLDELDAAVQVYNTAADRLQLIPVSAKRAEGVQFEISLDRSATAASDIINLDLKGVVKPALARLREAGVGRARELSEEALAQQERLDALHHTLTERTEENATLEVQVRKLEAAFRSSKEGLEAEVRSQAAQADKLKGEVAQLRHACSHSIADSEDRIRDLQAHYDDLQRAAEAETAQVTADLARALDALIEHKVHIQNTLTRVHNHALAVQQDVASITM
ncbi:hypothetical protein WJX72_001447 [[Myrmecia] bisecta]|uniref:Kinetochore protein NDC80 n=1 Tax=[Myrmecia] bisecta TaxID=41462 RepID=A0AAW1R4J2_9CHLO